MNVVSSLPCSAGVVLALCAGFSPPVRRLIWATKGLGAGVGINYC